MTLLTTGCARPAPQITLIFSHPHCQTLSQPLTWVVASDLPEIRGVRLLSEGPGYSTASLPEGHYLAVYAGEQTGVMLGIKSARLSWSTLYIDLAEQTSPQVGLGTEATTPCIILEVSSVAAFEQVRVQLEGKSFAEIAPPSKQSGHDPLPKQ